VCVCVCVVAVVVLTLEDDHLVSLQQVVYFMPSRSSAPWSVLTVGDVIYHASSSKVPAIRSRWRPRWNLWCMHVCACACGAWCSWVGMYGCMGGLPGFRQINGLGCHTLVVVVASPFQVQRLLFDAAVLRLA
jgi:hypothetical protein